MASAASSYCLMTSWLARVWPGGSGSLLSRKPSAVRDNQLRYRALYTADFKPGKGRSTADWEAERRQRLADARSPSLRIEGLRLKARDPDRSSTVFVQHYRAGNYRDTVRKQLDWVKADGQWKIAAETVLAPPKPAPAADTPPSPQGE